MDAFEDEQGQQGSGMDIKQLLRSVWRRKWLFIVPFVICLAMAAVVIKTMSPVYSSSALLRVVFERPTTTIVPDDVNYRQRPRYQDEEAQYMIQTIVTGPSFLERVAAEFTTEHPDLTRRWLALKEIVLSPQAVEADFNRALAAQLRRGVRVKYEDTHVFRIGIYAPDPELAYTVMQLLLDRFLEEERANRLRPSTATRQFLDEQRQQQEQKVAEAERRLTDFQSTMLSESLAGNPISEQNLAQVEGSLGRLRAQYLDNDNSELITLERQIRTTLGALPQLSQYVQDAEIASLMREMVDLQSQKMLGTASEDFEHSLGTLRLRLNGLLERRVAARHPDLSLADRNSIVQYLYQGAYRNVRQLVIDRLDADIREFREFMRRQPERSATLTSLQEDLQRERDLLADIERDITREDLRIEASLSEIGFKMVVHREPRLPSGPAEPDKVRLALMGVLLAAIMGAGLVGLSILLDRSLQSVAQIESVLAVPVIGTIPLIENEVRSRRRQRRYLLWITIVLVVLGLAAVGFLMVYPRLG
jgi:uncharacterized protein involved in exopolysaccharide biosynthesis